MPFQKGQSGNPAGRPPKGTSLTELMEEFLETIPEGEEVTYKEAFVQRVYQLAMKEGDPVLIKLIWNYIDGKPIERTQVKGKLDLILLHRLAGEARDELEKEGNGKP